MAYRSEIIRALDELIANEAGPLFQSIATVHAKQKWTQLIACERKWDGGLDAHADGALQSDGKGIGFRQTPGKKKNSANPAAIAILCAITLGPCSIDLAMRD